jgi:Ni,Fe-hydrogenase maturation factor
VNKIEKLINDIVCIVQDKEVSNVEEYINMEVESNKEEIINAIIEEIKERL